MINNPQVSIPVEYLISCNVNYSIEKLILVSSSADHPAFTELRKALHAAGLISIPEYPCWTGDKVLKRFKFNNIQLERGDTFYSGEAWGLRLRAVHVEQLRSGL